MSGAARPSLLRQKPPTSPMLEVSGPLPWPWSSSTLAGVSAVISV